MGVLVAIVTIVGAHCVALSSTESNNLQKTVLQEVTKMIGGSVAYECDTSEINTGSMCSCDPFCNRYGDCCIGIAQEVSREEYRCAQLERHGRYVWMRASCPGRERRSREKFMCEGTFTSKSHSLSFLVHIPAFHKPSQTLYRNVYCVLCNKGRLEDIYDWHIRLQSVGQAPPGNRTAGQLPGVPIYDVERRIYGIEEEGTVYNFTLRAAEFRWDNFSQEFNTTRCSPVVHTCPQGSDPLLVRKCELYAAYYTPHIRLNASYKNYHCALCNGVPLDTVEGDYKLGTDLKLLRPQIGTVGKEFAFEQESGSYFQFIFDPSIADMGCDEHEIRVPGLNSCHPFICEDGTRWDRSGKCVGPDGVSSCPWVVFERQWVTILPNLSLYLNFSGEIIGPDDYDDETWEGYVVACVSRAVTVVLDPTQEIIAEVCLAFSTLCLVLLIAVYVALPHLRARAAGRAVLCLSLSLALAQALFLIGNDLPPHTTSCKVVAIVVHFSYLASFFWMNALAIDICRSLAIHVFDTGSEHLFLWYSGYAWLCPTVLVGVAVLLDVLLEDALLRPNYGGNVCWICSPASLITFFLAPVAVLLIANAILFIWTARSLRSSRLSVAANRRDDPGIPFLLYVKLVLAFGLTWAFGFAAALTSARWLWYPFIFLSGLQGAFLFIAFACKKTVICDLRQRYFPKKKEKTAGETSSLPSGSTVVQPLVVRVRPSVEKSNKVVKDSVETKC